MAHNMREDPYDFLRQARILAEKGKFSEAEERLLDAAPHFGLVAIPLVGYGESGRYSTAETARL